MILPAVVIIIHVCVAGGRRSGIIHSLFPQGWRHSIPSASLCRRIVTLIADADAILGTHCCLMVVLVTPRLSVIGHTASGAQDRFLMYVAAISHLRCNHEHRECRRDEGKEGRQIVGWREREMVVTAGGRTHELYSARREVWKDVTRAHREAIRRASNVCCLKKKKKMHPRGARHFVLQNTPLTRQQQQQHQRCQSLHPMPTLLWTSSGKCPHATASHGSCAVTVMHMTFDAFDK